MNEGGSVILLLVVLAAVVLVVAEGVTRYLEYMAPAERHGSVPARPESSNLTERDRA